MYIEKQLPLICIALHVDQSLTPGMAMLYIMITEAVYNWVPLCVCVGGGGMYIATFTRASA